MSRTRVTFASAAMAASLLACGNGVEEGPASSARAYLDALRTGQWEKAWELVSAADREARPLDAFRDVPAAVETRRKALEPRTKHAIVSTKVEGDKATVDVDVEAPDAGPEAPLRTTRVNVRLVREAKQWKVDTEWAEEKEAEARRNRIQELTMEAARVFAAGDASAAKKLLEEALSLAPDDAVVREALAMIEADLKTIIAGQWRLTSQKDAMTDDENVYIALRAVAPVERLGEREFPVLVVRCAERSLDTFIVTHMMIDSDYGEIYQASGRYRIDEQPAKRVRFGLGDSRDTVFFTRPREWMALLAANARSTLSIELPVYQEGSRVIIFDLTGADVATGRALAACPSR